MKPLILITGATGYVGGRLVPRLLEQGYRVRCFVRDASRFSRMARWGRTRRGRRAEKRNASARRCAAWRSPTISCTASPRAPVFVNATWKARAISAQRRGKRVLSGLSTWVDLATRAPLSQIICNRGTTLVMRCGKAGCPVAEIRAGVIVGSGSLSFEMVRYLAERLPVMICPRSGFYPRPADRDPQPARLSARSAHATGERRRNHRDRRRGRCHVWRDAHEL